MRKSNVIAPLEKTEEQSWGPTVLYHATTFAKQYWELQVEECDSFCPKIVAQHSSIFLIPEGIASLDNFCDIFFSVRIQLYFLPCGSDLIRQTSPWIPTPLEAVLLEVNPFSLG